MPDTAILQKQAAAEIAQRSRSGVLAYPVIFSIIGVFSPYASDHSRFFTAIGILILMAALGRGVCAFWFHEVYKYNSVIWRRVNRASVVGLGLAWGMLSMMSIQYYGWNWTTMVTCLSAAAFSAGAVTALSIDLVAINAYLFVMFFPSLTVTAYTGTHESLAVTFLFGTYLIFLLHIAKQLNRQYWEALNNIHLLDERARELESFAYSVSHDLRAPLRTIDGFSNMLYEDASNRLTEEEVDYLKRVREAAQRMGTLIDDLLELSRISRCEFRPKKINLSRLAVSVIKKLQQQDVGRNVDIEIEPGVEANADSALLGLVLENLLGNAWKFSSQKNSPKIRFARTFVDGKTVYYVKDNGVGFNPRYKDKLFSPFQRLHHQEEFPGTGIGLATVKRIIDKHGGRVWANSKQNRGTTIYFTLSEPDKNVASRNHAPDSFAGSELRR